MINKITGRHMKQEIVEEDRILLEFGYYKLYCEKILILKFSSPQPLYGYPFKI
jgi:hypothetical protein